MIAASASHLPPFPAKGESPPDPSPAGLKLRTATRADLPFFLQLFAAFRAPELLLAPWSAEQKQAFIDSQFSLQHTHFVHNFPRADFWVIERGGVPGGRLYLDRTQRDWRIIELGLAPALQGAGLGSALIGWVQTSARTAGKRVALSVAVNNPRAQALYRRLGFMETTPGAGEMHIEMIWQAA